MFQHHTAGEVAGVGGGKGGRGEGVVVEIGIFFLFLLWFCFKMLLVCYYLLNIRAKHYYFNKPVFQPIDSVNEWLDIYGQGGDGFFQ